MIHSDFTPTLARRANAARQQARLTPTERGNGAAYRTSTETVLRMDDEVTCPHLDCPLRLTGQTIQRRDFHQHVRECHS